MSAGTSPISPQRREAYCAARACGYGPSAAHTMARYASPDRVTASRNAQRLERDASCGIRIDYLKAHPDLAMTALRDVMGALDEQAGEIRNEALKTVMGARKKAKDKRDAPAYITPPQNADTESLADLLELILDESQGLVERCRSEGADTIVTKAAIDLHRSAASARERFLNVAKEADQAESASVKVDTSSLNIYANMQRQLGEAIDHFPEAATQDETTIADTRDAEHLRYNITVTLEQIDKLSIGKIPAVRDQIRLYEALLKSVVKLSQIISRREVITRETRTLSRVVFDPTVSIRWMKLNNLEF